MENEKSKDILKMAQKTGLIDKPSSVLKNSLKNSGIQNNAPGVLNYTLYHLFMTLSEHCSQQNKKEN